jgi:hypothetical protein
MALSPNSPSRLTSAPPSLRSPPPYIPRVTSNLKSSRVTSAPPRPRLTSSHPSPTAPHTSHRRSSQGYHASHHPRRRRGKCWDLRAERLTSGPWTASYHSPLPPARTMWLEERRGFAHRPWEYVAANSRSRYNICIIFVQSCNTITC